MIHYLGIDVSCRTLEVSDALGTLTGQFANTPKGVASLMGWVHRHVSEAAHMVLEPTSTYHHLLVVELNRKRVPYTLVNRACCIFHASLSGRGCRMSALLPWGKRMAGTHHVKVRRPHISYCFQAWAYPSHPLGQIPFLGPFFTFNLGHNPRFVIKVKYLGYESTGEERVFDSVSIPPPEHEALWDLDVGLVMDGKYVEGGDVIHVDLSLTTLRHKTQRYTTRTWPLSRSGKAALEIEYGEEAIYSFEVKDISFQVAAVFLAILGGIVGSVVTWLVTS